MNVLVRSFVGCCGAAMLLAAVISGDGSFSRGALRDLSQADMSHLWGKGTIGMAPAASNNACAGANIADACPYWSAPAAGCGSVACELDCSQTQNNTTRAGGLSKARLAACGAANQETCTAGSWFGCYCTGPVAMACGNFTEVYPDGCS
jgi:hypothetical protein